MCDIIKSQKLSLTTRILALYLAFPNYKQESCDYLITLEVAICPCPFKLVFKLTPIDKTLSLITFLIPFCE